MSTQLKLRRGTTAQHSTFTGAEGEVTVDTTKDTLVVHDGTTAGGHPLMQESGSSSTDVFSLGTDQVYKDASGKLGLGTASPAQTLDVVGSIKFSGATYENVFTITDGASVNLNPANGTIQLWTLGATRTPTATSFAAGQSMTLMIDDGSAASIVWTTIGVVWKTGSGVAPTLQTTGYTAITLWKVGSIVYGARVGNA